MTDTDPYVPPADQVDNRRPGVLGARSRVAIVSLCASTVVCVLGTLVWLLEASGVWTPRTSSPPPSMALRSLVMFGDCVTALVMFGTHAAFLVWLHRAVQRSEFVSRAPTHSPLWSVAVWFLPLVNLVGPYFVLRRLWSASCESDSSRSNRAPRFLRVWWTLWVFNVLATGVGVALAPLGPFSPAQIAATCAAALAYLASAFCAVRFIRLIARTQRERLGVA